MRAGRLAVLTRTFGIILAGGRAQRMGGANKALVTLAGETLLARCIARLAPQCTRLLLSANDDPQQYAINNIAVIDDDFPAREGALAGLLATLDHVDQHHAEASFIASVPVDTPFLPHDLVARLHAARREDGGTITVAASGGQLHHAVALWPVAIRGDMQAAFAAGERSVGRYASRHRVSPVEWPSAPVDPFFNINTPQDLAEAEAIIARHGESGR